MNEITSDISLCWSPQRQGTGIIIFTDAEKNMIMRKLLIILMGALALACGNSDRSTENEAAAEEDVEVGSGEEISPQLELDSADNRFEVDSISSADEANKEADGDDF